MGKSTKRKQEEVLAQQPDYTNIFLTAKTTHILKEAAIASYDPMTVIRGYEEFAVRPLDKFVPRTRSLNHFTRIKELVRYAFNKYTPPAFLYTVWDDGQQHGTYRTNNTKYDYLFGLREDFHLWYIALAQGKSLYKECTMGLLTKRETFYFSTCPYIISIPEAVWYSVVRCMDEKQPIGLVRKIAASKIHERPVDDFWRGVARWFIANETSIKNMNDLLDYISLRHHERPDWYIKDQTLNNLQRAMASWHRELYRMTTMSAKYTKWDGFDLDDSEIERGQGRKKVIWRFHQIKTGKELAEEGNKQHHCVSSYGHYCVKGECFIWSLTREENGLKERALTIEQRDEVIVQARGYSNRLPRAEELSVLREWAAKNKFRIHSNCIP